MPAPPHDAASARLLFFGRLACVAAFSLNLIAWRAWFDLAAFWISGVRGRTLAAFRMHDAGWLLWHWLPLIRCAVSALWCQEMPQGGPIAAHRSLRNDQSGVCDGPHYDESAGHRCVVVQGFDPVRG